MQKILLILCVVFMGAAAVLAQDDVTPQPTVTITPMQIPLNFDDDLPPRIEAGIPIQIQLDNVTTHAGYEFESAAGEMWSFQAQTIWDTADPMLFIYAPDGTELAANDNETRASTDARIDGWMAPESGTYMIEVARSGYEDGPTQGTVRVTAQPGYSRNIELNQDVRWGIWIYDLPVFLTQEAITPNKSLYVRFYVDFGDITEPLPGTLILELVTDTGPGWMMHFNKAEATWTLLLKESENQPTESIAIAITESYPLESGNYALLISGATESANQQLTLWYGNQVIVSQSVTLPAAWNRGRLAVHSAGNALKLSDIRVNIPFYNDMPAEAGAIAPTAREERLFTSASVPLDIMAELRELGQVRDGGGLIMRLPRGIIETSDPGFSAYPPGLPGDIQDFVLSFDAGIRTGGAGAACGVQFRAVDNSTFATAMISGNGDAYILQYKDGYLQDNRAALHHPIINPGIGPDITNRIIVVAQDDRATLYINGYRVAEAPVIAQPGNILLNVVLEDNSLTRCTLDNMWLWSLDESDH